MTPDFEHIAFVDGFEFIDRWGDAQRVCVRQVGTFEFTSGRVVVADALATDFTSPPVLEDHAPLGQFPVFVSVLEGPNDVADVAVLWIKFSDNAVHHWYPAYYEGHDPDDHYEPWFGVDSGTACIADAAVVPDLSSEDKSQRLLAKLNDVPAEPWTAIFHPDATSSFIASTSGIGDGLYTTYWGSDTQQAPVYLAVDFDVIHVPDWMSFELQLPLSRGPIKHEVVTNARATLRVQQRFLGRPKVKWAGLSFPRIRLFRDGALVREIQGDFGRAHATFEIDGQPGDTLEVSFDRAHVSSRAIPTPPNRS